MSVSSISTQGSSAASISGNTTVAQLQQQLQSLEQQIQKENQSKDSTKTKEEVVKELEQEIQMVQMQIQQAQAKAAKKSSNQGALTQSTASPVGQAGAGSQSNSSLTLDAVA
jgi:predicted RNase H-like nuclease (RuvC/YqgF family)